jgi:hypothetical protein
MRCVRRTTFLAVAIILLSFSAMAGEKRECYFVSIAHQPYLGILPKCKSFLPDKTEDCFNVIELGRCIRIVKNGHTEIHCNAAFYTRDGQECKR